MELTKDYLRVKKSELPFPVIVEDDLTENCIIQEMNPGTRRLGSYIGQASKNVVRRINRLIRK